MRSLLSYFVLIAVLISATVSPVRAGGQIVEGDPSDQNVTSTVVGNGAYAHLYTFLCGTLFSGDNGVIVEAFPLPYLEPGQTVTGASFSMYLNKQVPTPQSPANFNLSLTGLKRVSTLAPDAIVADWYVGTNDPINGPPLTTSFVTPATPLNSVVTYSGANLAAFINNQYTNVAFTGKDMSKTRFIFLRVNANSNVQNAGFCNYQFSTSRNPVRTQHPTLALTISGGVSAIAGRLQFSFNLPQDSTTSAGVYNATTGVLMRTLWNNVRYTAGTNYGYWDGNDDTGKALPTGTGYQIKLIYHNVQYVFNGMVGNTSASQSGPNVYRSFGKIHDMTFSGGSAFYAIGYNELGAPFHQFAVGAPQVPSPLNFGYDLADPYSAFYYCTSDGTRTYWAKVFGGLTPPGAPAGNQYGVNTFVVAINKSSNTFYSFPKGTAMTTGNFEVYPSCVDYDTTVNQTNPAYGIAVQQTGNCLFVSHKNLNVVRVFDKVQGNLLGTISVPSPSRLACTANGDVWIVSSGATPSVFRYSFAGGTGTLKQTLTGFNAPAGVGVSADDSLVLVTDGGTAQQIKAFNNTTGAKVWTYGTLGGNPINGPAISSSTFDFNTQEANSANFSNEAFVAFQPDNTFWVEDGGNGRIMHFSMSGSSLTYIEMISFVDASYRATADLTDSTRVFNNFMEYAVDYSKPLAGSNGSWSLAKNWIVGLPNDATHQYVGFANGFTNVVTMSNGRTYGFLENLSNNNIDLFELPANGPVRYTGITYANNIAPLIYPDSTLRFNVTNGDSTAITLYSQPLTGFDANNNPVWGSPMTLASSALNVAVDPIPWGAFPMRTEVTASGGVVVFDGFQANSGAHLGCLGSGSTKWTFEASKSVNGPTWFPQDGSFDIGNGVQYAGNYAMALDRNIVYGYHGEFWKNGEASQWINFLDNGLMVGLFGTYADSTIAAVATDGYAGNSFSPSLVHGPNGTVFLYHNDESNHAGSVRWEIKGWNNITEMDGSGALGTVIALGANTSGPTVSISSPTPGAIFSNGSNVNLSAQAASSGAAITSVQFMDGAASLGSVSTAPFVMAYSGMSAGSHVITAKATDSAGLTSTSAAVTISIGGDGTSAPPPAPVSLSSTGITAQSVTLNWTEPAIGTTSTTIGQILSFQFDSPSDTAFGLKPTDVAGVAPYAAANWNLLGVRATGSPQYISVNNNAGTTLTNFGEYLGVGPSNSVNSTNSMTGTTLKVFSSEVTTNGNTVAAVSFSNIPYALYDVVVYSLPGNIKNANQSTTVTVNNVSTSSLIQQAFNKLPTGFSTTTVPFGGTASVTNIDTVIVTGVTGPAIEIQGANICGVQIVERPYDQGTPTSYTIQRASGSSGTFTTIGTASGSATSFTDTSGVSASATYQYRIQAVNSFGPSANSNVVTVTTPAANNSGTTNFASWQSSNFTADQLQDPSISGPTADPYGSGVPNLLAYALGLDPKSAQPTDVPSPVITNGHLTVTYFVPSSISDISYIVEVSSDLVNWNSGTGYTQVISSVASANGTTITVQDALPAATQKHFMRLRVTQNP